MNEKRLHLNRAVCERKGWRCEKGNGASFFDVNAITGEVKAHKGYKLVEPGGYTRSNVFGAWSFMTEDGAWEYAANYAGDLNLAWNLVQDLEGWDRNFIFSFYKDRTAEEIASIICEIWIPWYDLNH